MTTPSDDRPTSALRLLVPDSGRTWAITYQQIPRIPPSSIQRGDVFIVRNEEQDGVMFMQATRRNKTAWKLETVEPEGQDQ